MATIDSIPLELVAQILGHLDSMASLRRAIRTSRRFHKAFVELPHTAHHILRNQIPGPLLPIAIAISKAAAAPKGTLSPEPFLDSLLEQPGDLASEIHGLSLPALATMSRTHSVIDEFATDFARGAWATLSEHVHGQSQPLTLSPDEELRIFRAFYRMELYFSLSRHVDTFDDKFGPSFCLRFAPWELEQISSVQEYLEARFAQGNPRHRNMQYMHGPWLTPPASREPLEHDITMGEFSIDYLKSGPDNYPRQHWVGPCITAY